MILGLILQELVFSVAAVGFFGITYPTYNNFVLEQATVGIIRMLPFPATGDSATMRRHHIKCSRFCAFNARCASSYAAKSSGGIFVRCILLSSNLCTNQQGLDLAPLPNSGAQLYDKILDSRSSQSCNENCMLNNPGNCSVCQRPGCTGLRCETCGTTCLQCYKYVYPGLSLQEKVECTIWLGAGNLYKKTVNCLGSKTLLFQRFNFPNGTSVGWDTFAFDTCTDLINTTQKFLYIELFSDNFTWPSYTTTYAGLNCFTNKSIALESLVNGTDGLGVPISPSVPFVEDANSYTISCGPFWLLNVSNFGFVTNDTPYGLGPCPGLSTAFFGTPSTVFTFRSGIAWAALPNITLIGVKVYMY